MQTILATPLAQYTDARLLAPRLTGHHQESVVNELSKRLESAGRIENADVFADLVLARDELATMIFDDVAFPLGRSETVKEISFAAGVAAQPIHWGAARGSLVRVVVLIAMPPREEAGYLSLVSAFSHFLKDKASVAALQRCTQPEEMIEIFRQTRF